MRHIVVVTLDDVEEGAVNIRISPEGVVRRVFVEGEVVERDEQPEIDEDAMNELLSGL